MMLLNFLVAFSTIYADVIREDGYHNYEGQFTVLHKGRMLRVLMYFNQIQLEACALYCVRHLRCSTFNYHPVKKAFELTDEDFDEMNADTISSGWYNHGTPAKVDGGWSFWRNLTECSKKCGSGTIEQWRDCDSPKPEHGGADCKGRMRRTVKCNTHECTVDGGWSSWRNFTVCTKKCGSGTIEQWRNCDSPKPEHGGDDCKGRMRRRVKCNTHECTVVNVALKKKATQSSTYSIYLPSNVVDGDNATEAMTQWENSPWWEVDLGEVKVIENIRLNAYVSANPNKGLSVEIREKKVERWIICKTIGDVRERIKEFKCDEKTAIARFLRIRATKRCFLDLFEVEVFGN